MQDEGKRFKRQADRSREVNGHWTPFALTLYLHSILKVRGVDMAAHPFMLHSATDSLCPLLGKMRLRPTATDSLRPPVLPQTLHRVS